MLSDRKILVTGAAGQIAEPLCEYLAVDNEVWGLARFSRPGGRDELERAGVTTVAVDLADPDFTDVPTDFTHVFHLAAAIDGSTDYDRALRVNAEGTGLLLSHVRNVEAALVMSTASVYKPNPDPHHRYLETDPLGEVIVPGMPTYAVTKIAEEAVARFCARAFSIPTVIARMNAAYGPRGGLPAYHLDAVVAGATVNLRHDPCPYSPIHQDDINSQAAALLDAATTPATVVNWGGDDEVGPFDWCRVFGELAHRPPTIEVNELPGSQPGNVLDNTRRLALTGPCEVRFPDGFERLFNERYPDGVDGTASGIASPLAPDE